MVRQWFKMQIGARLFGLFGLILFPVTSVVCVCYDNRNEFKTFYTDCIDMILLRDSEKW